MAGREVAKDVIEASVNRMYSEAERRKLKKYIEEKVKNLKEILEARQFEEQLNEEKFIEQKKPKKAAKDVIEASVNRMYSEAERRKLKINKKITEQFVKGKIKEDEQEREKEMEAKDYVPKKKQTCKYNFQSDTEKSDDENAYMFNKGISGSKSRSKEKNIFNGLSKKQQMPKSVSKSKTADAKSKSKSKQKKTAKIINQNLNLDRINEINYDNHYVNDYEEDREEHNPTPLLTNDIKQNKRGSVS